MAQSITTMSEDDQDSEVLWMSHCKSQVIGMIRTLKDNPSTDCAIIVGETRIPVHKAVVQLNSSMLTSWNAGFDKHSEATEIEVEPEFDNKPELIKEIVRSFYSGTIDIDEAVLKEVYKFSAIYEIKWLKAHTGRLIVNYLTKSMYGCYERFTDIFSLAHFIWDTNLFECCIQVIDKEILELLMKDNDMLGKMSYTCMEIFTMSSNVGFPEKDLFDLLATWVTCKKQTCKKIVQKLFENIRYELLDKDFVIKRVMTYASQNEDIFSISFLKIVLEGMSHSSNDMCRSELMKENALKRVQITIDTIISSDKKYEAEKIDNEVNSFLIRKDIRYLPDEMKEELSNAIGNEYLICSLDWLSVVNLINNHHTENTADLLGRYTARTPSVFYKLDWTKVTDKSVIYVIENKRDYGAVLIAISWCLANRGTTDDATLQKITSEFCYKGGVYDDVYKSNILLPTIKHLLPDTTELKCQHSGNCGPMTWTLSYEIKTVNKKLYELEPFEDDVATLTDNNGVLELKFNCKDLWLMFIKNKPYEPFYPAVYSENETLDDETLKRFISTLQDGDEIVILNVHAKENYLLKKSEKCEKCGYEKSEKCGNC